MVNLTEHKESTTGHWRELWSSPYSRTTALVAGGVVLYSTNEFLTISMLPSTINEIGGERIYAWVTTLYLVGSVVASATACCNRSMSSSLQCPSCISTTTRGSVPVFAIR